MKVLGIDPGSRHMGYGFVERVGTKYVRLASGVLEPPEKDYLPARLAYLYEKLTEVFVQTQAKEVSVEGVFFYKNPQSAFVLGQARAIALLAAHQAGAKVFEYPPTRVKISAAGTGKATKEQVQRMIKVLLGLAKEPPPDEADALANAICHLDAFRAEVPKASQILPELALRRR
jgi:crossover junction endodeoxyribonuclease RuvC